MTGRVLVTGGCGFIGSAVVRDLLARGFTVTAFDDLSAGTLENLPRSSRIAFVNGDVTSEGALRTAIDGHDAVVHLSALPYIPDSWSHEAAYWKQNALATEAVLRMAFEDRAPRVVVASTAEVYGISTPVPVAEDHAVEPVSPYGRSKAAAEEAARSYQDRGLPVVILRLFNAYGPREGWPFVIPEIVRQCLKEDRVHVGNVDSRRDFTSVDDTAAAVTRAVASESVDGATINIGSGSSYAVGEITGLVRAMTGCEAPVVVDPARLRSHDPSDFVADNATAKRLLGWVPTIGLENGLRQTIEWYRAAGGEWLYERRSRERGGLLV